MSGCVSRRRWREVIFISLVALTVLAAAEVFARSLDGSLEPLRWGTRVADAKAEQMTDFAATDDEVAVVFLGSSLVEAGFDMDVLAREGITGYNASLSAASVRTMRLWSEAVVLRHLDPKVVVIGIGARDLNDNGLDQEDLFRRLQNSRGVEASLGREPIMDRLGLTSASRLIELRNELRVPVSIAQGILGRVEPPNIGQRGDSLSRRYDVFSREEAADQLEYIKSRSLNDYAIGGVEAEALKDLVGSLVAAGKSVLLVEMPVLRSYLSLSGVGYGSISARVKAEIDAFLSRGCVKVMTFEDEWPEEFFADVVHLNLEGASRLTSMVLDDVELLLNRGPRYGCAA